MLQPIRFRCVGVWISTDCLVCVYIYKTRCNVTQFIYLFLENALHVSGDISTDHQEHIKLYLQHLALVKP